MTHYFFCHEMTNIVTLDIFGLDCRDATDTSRTHPEWPPLSHTDLAPGTDTGLDPDTSIGQGPGPDPDNDHALVTGPDILTGSHPDTAHGSDIVCGPGTGLNLDTGHGPSTDPNPDTGLGLDPDLQYGHARPVHFRFLSVSI